MTKTKIEWATHVWNPVWGCENNCSYCYARKIAHRFNKSFKPHWVEKNFKQSMPRKPARIFVNSMSEIAYWKEEWMIRVLWWIDKWPDQQFLFLTKNYEIYDQYKFPKNCWLGVTITKQRDIKELTLSAFNNNWMDKNSFFYSVEPMMEPIKPSYIWPNWIIFGAETGNRKEKVIPQQAWVQEFIDGWQDEELPGGEFIPCFIKNNFPWKGKRPQTFPEGMNNAQTDQNQE